jgi:hypothetical protein
MEIGRQCASLPLLDRRQPDSSLLHIHTDKWRMGNAAKPFGTPRPWRLSTQRTRPE